ncbi:MAG TPA: hypothetical protein VHM90_09840 [Phycisphaerae bacterium]|nr:hypothetical protein [Phycisphaerae bacterium]
MAASSPSPSWRSTAQRDQAYAAAVGVVLLAVSALCLNWLNAQRPALVREDPESEKTLGSLAVTFPRLTLGGVRGIASTYLWLQAEDDKNDRKWIELESKYTKIGALQPYFASVYIYHSWNEAYNLSAQWQEQETKYKWVLDGIAYLYKGEDFNPANPDIMYEESQLYAMKLGGAFERIYYRQHWRSDISQLHTLNTTATAKTDAAVALQHIRYFINHRDPRDPPPPTPEELKKKTDAELRALCDKYNIDVVPTDTPSTLSVKILETVGSGSYFHARELGDPAGKLGGTGWGVALTDPNDPLKQNVKRVWGPSDFNLFKGRTDGKKATDPVIFRYGVSPFYFAYCEFRRCLDIPASPTYTGRQVVDSWPAMSLRLWCRDDLYFSYDTMRLMFGKKPDPNLLAPGVFDARIAEVHDCFRNVQMIAPRAVDLFVYHLDPKRTPSYAYNISVHNKHIEESKAYIEIGKAENRLFDALVQWHINGEKLDRDGKIRAAFQDADTLYRQAYVATMHWVETVYPAAQNNPDRADFEKYGNALEARRRGIQGILQAMDNNTKPDMSFLDDEVVER